MVRSSSATPASCARHYLIALLCFAFIATPSLYLILAQPSVLGAVSAAGLALYFIYNNRKTTKKVEHYGFEPD